MSIYLDNNATTAIDVRVLDVMLPYLKDVTGNPSSMHQFGRRARAAIDVAREQVAALVGAQSSEVIFTSGGTEANNLAIIGAAQKISEFRMACSPLEHPCVLEPSAAIDPTRPLLPVDENGIVDVEKLAVAVAQDKPHLISVMLANNETGVIQPIKAIAEIAKASGSLLHVDAVQAVGKMSVNMAELGADLLTISSHKIYGPKGMGALVVRNGVDIAPLQRGGGQEDGLRSGTENLAAIVGFGKAAELAEKEWPARAEALLKLRQGCESKLATFSNIEIFAQAVERLPNTIMFACNGIDGETLLMQLDQAGIAVASGSACHSAQPEPSHVLTAMGVPFEKARSAIRISFGKDNTIEDVEAFIRALEKIINRFSSMAGVKHDA